MQSALVALLNAGISGQSLGHSDVGGYTTIDYDVVQYTRDSKLLLRWAEMSAFSDALLRTHPGLKPEKMHQIYSDNQTLSRFARCANIHRVLGDYKQELMIEAQQHGWPMARALFLHYPEDPIARSESVATSEFLLGSELLVAPQFSSSATEVS